MAAAIDSRTKQNGKKRRRSESFMEIVGNVYIPPRPKIREEATDCQCKSECGDDCLNRMTHVECGSMCAVGDDCTNRRFQKREYAPCATFETENGDNGLKATADIPADAFIGEYIGEVINEKKLAKRQNYHSIQGYNVYVLPLERGFYIDATEKGNKFRFINHSCDPNAEQQKWIVDGKTRIGFFSIKPIPSGEEITSKYQFQLNGKKMRKNESGSKENIAPKVDEEELVLPDDREQAEVIGDLNTNRRFQSIVSNCKATTDITADASIAEHDGEINNVKELAQHETDSIPVLLDDRVRSSENCQHKLICRGRCMYCKTDVEICDRNCQKDHNCKKFNMYDGKCLDCGQRARECCC